MYAQTIVQLYNQLKTLEYSDEDVARVYHAYSLVKNLFSGIVRQSGVPLVDHLVGTVSIAAHHGLPIEMLLTALLHATYLHGDFGSIRDKRLYVRAVVGSDVEERIYQYSTFKCSSATLQWYAQNFSKSTIIEKEILVLRLINELEDHLDLKVLYNTHVMERKRHIQQFGKYYLELAKALLYPQLAEELERAFAETLTATVPKQLVRSHRECMIYLPKSYAFPLHKRSIRFLCKIRKKMRVRTRLKQLFKGI